jgi:hypothetical protein
MARKNPEPVEAERVPAPYDNLTGSTVYSPNWGTGWLGYDIFGDRARFWFVPEDLSCRFEVEYDEIYQYNDRWSSHLWVIYHCNGPTPETLPFLLHPPEGRVVFPLPSKLKRFVED